MDARFNNPGELLEAMPHVIGYHPRDELFIVLVQDATMKVMMPCELPLNHVCEHVWERVHHLINEVDADSFFLLGYGSHEHVSAAVDAFMPRLASRLHMVAAFRVERGHYYMYGGGPGCDHDTHGVPLPVGSPAAVHTAVTDGVAFPDKEAAFAYLQPVTGTERHRSDFATLLTIMQMTADYFTDAAGAEPETDVSAAPIVDDARACLAAAVETYRDADAHLDEQRLAKVALSVLIPILQDETMALIGADAAADQRDGGSRLDAHRRLWFDAMRHAHTRIAATPAALFACAAMAGSDGARAANAVLEYAMACDPNSSLAEALAINVFNAMTSREHVTLLTSATVDEIRAAAGQPDFVWLRPLIAAITHIVAMFDPDDVLAAQRLTPSVLRLRELLP
ncbi:DUF4192 domain-containing protein [Nonomuraea polychroma]|uniref:DUF4192 domain-containing protein n=1 Tax=Nonomuraea polychroma TaxID=46176 RepID=UPI003D8D7E65